MRFSAIVLTLFNLTAQHTDKFQLFSGKYNINVIHAKF